MTDKTLTRRSILKYLSAATLLSGAITAASVAQAQRVDKKDEKNSHYLLLNARDR